MPIGTYEWQKINHSFLEIEVSKGWSPIPNVGVTFIRAAGKTK
jgi:hypothetical protein